VGEAIETECEKSKEKRLEEGRCAESWATKSHMGRKEARGERNFRAKNRVLQKGAGGRGTW
jgi:hypothetical protein